MEASPNGDVLLGCYLVRDVLEGARHLLRAYEEDASAVFHWGRVLERILSGDFKNAEQALQQARKHNRFVEPYLTGKKKLPRALPDSYSFGSDEEALICLDSLGAAWIAHPESLMWLLLQNEEVGEAHQPLPKRARETSRQPLLF